MTSIAKMQSKISQNRLNLSCYREIIPSERTYHPPQTKLNFKLLIHIDSK